MNCKYISYLLILMLIFPLAILADQAGKQPELRQFYKDFLDEVYWIISDYERNAFLTLKTDEERDRFIKSFWDSRDPTPGTAENEFKKEHEKRYAYTRLHFNNESALPGWKTDRGKIYIIMGKPEFIKRYNNPFDFYPMEMWQYVGDKGYGLPTSLVLLFYQRGGAGPYRLYSPLSDGMLALFQPKQEFYKMDATQLWETIGNRLDPEVASAALSMIPTEGGSPTEVFDNITAEQIVSKINNAKNYQVEKRNYVEDILQNRGTVHVYYSIGTEGIRDGFYWFQAPNGNYYINYAVEYEPDKVDIGEYEDYYTSLNVDGQITTPDKVIVDQITGTSEIRLTKEQYEQVKSIPFQYQGIRPVLPGKYAITLVLSNNLSRKSVTFTHDIEIPDVSAAKVPYVTPLLPMRSAETVDKEGRKLRPFQMEDQLLVPNIPARYSQNSSMQVYHQVIFPAGFQEPGITSLHYVVRNADKVEWETTQTLNYPASDLAGNAIGIRREIPLSGLALGTKQLEVEVQSNNKVLARSTPITFYVQTQVNQAIWKFSSGIPNYDSPYHSFTLAQQLIRLKRAKEALAVLEDAYKKYPDSLDIQLSLMRVGVLTKNYARTLEIGAPLEIKNPRNKDLLWLMGWASYGLGKFDDAVRLFERYMLEDPKRVEVLNLLADSYYRLDQPAKSLEKLQQSLALNPDQQDMLDLKKRLESRQ